MMLVSIKDTKSLSFGRPAPAVNKDVAIRDVKILVNDNQSTLISKFPEDFELWQVGEFHEDTGILDSKLEVICNLGSLKEAQ